jgi:ubiquinone/menaquinone biosynthesis C-methylase UbiE
MLAYARKDAEDQKLDDRVQFWQMDALQTLNFPDGHFDLVNQRSGGSYLRTWDWPRLLEEMLRVTQPGGTIRLTEIEEPFESTSEALISLNRLFFQVLYQAGHFSCPNNTGLINRAAHLLDSYGIQKRQTRVHTLQYRSGTVEGGHFTEDMKLIYQTLIPFFSRWTRLPSDYQETYQQMLKDFQQPDFLATWKLVTLWGTSRARGSGGGI